MLSHDNPGERPFAIAKYLAHLYPNMTLDNKSKVAHAMANKTFRRQESPVKQKVSSRQVAPTRAGVAFTAPKPVTDAIHQLCSNKGKDSVLKTQVSLVCSDLDSSRSHEKKRKQVKMNEAQIKRAKVAESKDVYGEVKLVTSTQALSQMLAAKRSDSQRVSFLLEQCNARTKGKSFTYDEINSDFLRHKKMRL